MTAAKNITRNSINENLSRVQAGLIAVTGIILAVTGHWLLALLLAYDFSVRLFVSPKLSPFYLFAQAINSAAALGSCPVDAEPKLFAARIWLAASLFALYFTLGGNHLAAIAIAAVLALCSAAEALLNFCVGCRIYTSLKRFNIEITSLKD